ncbi:MAG: ROK family transcriptional regulator [Egibacteraceae bacterium]
MRADGVSGPPRVLRHLNRNHVLRVVRESGPISRPAIAQLTGLSRPTVNDVVGELVRGGVVDDGFTEPASARPGPRARLVSFRARAGHVLGVDIGGTKVVVHLADLAGTILATRRARTAAARSRTDVLRTVRDCADQVIAMAQIPLSSVRAVGVGTPGVVDPATGALALAPQLPDWEGIVLSEELDPRLDAPVHVANEVHLAVLGERWRGAARDVRDAVYLHIGVGIGLGILIDDQLYRGSAGAAGEIGYLPLTDADADRPEGIGALEYAASGAGFARRGRHAAEKPGGERLRELAGGDPDAVSAETIFQALRDGDPVAAGITEELVELLARATASACLVLNPATVILGGGLSQAGAALAEPLARRVRSLVPIPPRLEISELGDLAVAYGAVRLALDVSDERLYRMSANGERRRTP